MKLFLRFLLLFPACFIVQVVYAQDNAGPLIYRFSIKENIAPPVLRTTQKAIKEAHALKADYILIEMNTYGGLVDAADSIRTIILKSQIPVMVLIENNAASAGALISLACDSIYMYPGATIGAATVVDQSGQKVPDKYQSYMRKKMRATAEINGRDPDMAEAMVENDSGKVLTLTTAEAIEHGFCEGSASSVPGLLKMIGITDYEIRDYSPTWIDKVIGFLINPMISGLLIMIIIGGIYFELQTPGVGFPLIASATAATLYFAPLYLEGLAENWEILVFVIGLGLLIVELFVVPGFGVIGIGGIALMLTGLTLSLVGNIGFEFPADASATILRSLVIVILSAAVSISLCLYLGGKLLDSHLFRKVVLATELAPAETYSGPDTSLKNLIGKTGTAATRFYPSGKVEIDGEIYPATALTGYLEKGDAVKVVKYETTQLFVVKA